MIRLFCLASLTIYSSAYAHSSITNYASYQLTQQHKDETFDAVFKPIDINYLFDLYDQNPSEHERLSQYFKVHQIIGHKKKKKLVAYSLFWKPQEVINSQTIHEIRQWKEKKCSFYDKYVSPIIQGIKYYQDHEKNTAVRIYLAKDLAFLIKDFLKPNTEIYLMETSSIGHSPGAMWRFLALNDQEAKYVSIHDADNKVREDMESQTNKWFEDPSTYGFYRYCSYRLTEYFHEAIYSPIQAGLFGSKCLKKFDIEKAMKGFILHREMYPDEERHPRDIAYLAHPYGFGNTMPAYGFDERFLKHVIYFYAAKRGILTTLCLKKRHLDNYYDLKNGSGDYLRVKDYRFVLQNNRKAIYH